MVQLRTSKRHRETKRMGGMLRMQFVEVDIIGFHGIWVLGLVKQVTINKTYESSILLKFRELKESPPPKTHIQGSYPGKASPLP